MNPITVLADREIKLLRAALHCRAPYQCDGATHQRIRLERLADQCAGRRPRPFTDPRPTAEEYLTEARKDYAQMFAGLSRAQLEEAALQLAADAARLRRELDDERGVIR